MTRANRAPTLPYSTDVAARGNGDLDRPEVRRGLTAVLVRRPGIGRPRGLGLVGGLPRLGDLASVRCRLSRSRHHGLFLGLVSRRRGGESPGLAGDHLERARGGDGEQRRDESAEQPADPVAE